MHHWPRLQCTLMFSSLSKPAWIRLAESSNLAFLEHVFSIPANIWDRLSIIFVLFTAIFNFLSNAKAWTTAFHFKEYKSDLTISVLQACCAVTTEYGIPSDFVRKSTASLQIKIQQHNLIFRIAGIHLEKDMSVPFGHTVARTVCLLEILCALISWMCLLEMWCTPNQLNEI